MKYVNMHEAKTHLSRIVKEVAEGEDVVISRSGTPVVRLVPVEEAKRPRKPGSMKGKVWISPDFDEEMPEILAGYQGEGVKAE
jgi:prevent-host-death family protein